tara:strand:- start:534 stop:986 length:453 start_codon:yes stop_codon:yes gene_type:complete
MIKIFIDADACPVKEEVYKVSIRNKLEVLIVSNGGIRPHPNPLIKSIFVGNRFNEADEYILKMVSKDDIVITNDIPLAADCIKKGAIIIKQNGNVLNENNIANELSKRNLMTEIRAANPFMNSKGKPFSNTDKSNFLNELEAQIRYLMKK